MAFQDPYRTLPAPELRPAHAGAGLDPAKFCGFLMSKVLDRNGEINRDFAGGRDLHGRLDGRG
ncbi:MAG: hypothetical protein KBI44_21085, partial [Thermoanaerobaculia bacterium]|nr:hypothetical protein [Thermoanaerobaculia bacterium]